MCNMVIEKSPMRLKEFVALLHHLQQCGKITKSEANEFYHSLFDNNSDSFERDTAYIHE